MIIKFNDNQIYNYRNINLDKDNDDDDEMNPLVLLFTFFKQFLMLTEWGIPTPNEMIKSNETIVASYEWL